MKLPSMRKSDLHLHLVYPEVINLSDDLPSSCCYLDVRPDIAREVIIQDTRQGPVGLVVRPVSQWFREYPDSYWEFSSYWWSPWSETPGSFSLIQDDLGSKQSLPVRLASRLHTDRASLWALAPQGVGTSCSLRMTCIILERFALSNWQQTLSFLQYNASTLDILHLSADDPTNYGIAIARLAMFKILATTSGSGSSDGNPIIPINASDWVFIFKELHILKELMQERVDSYLATRKMYEDKRSQSQSHRLGLMTLLLGVFVPMSFSTGLFSMAEDFAAGKPKFWIFWCVSIPLTIIVFAVWQLANMRYFRRMRFRSRIISFFIYCIKYFLELL
ncbi:hypothetical protein LCI18_011706 [Fusarium solani-melongenae]|uniref:Uncharacterized protein n=1 Tax=Fusarium solani subsp. cucurbitae TaxID=2747967 RepID=A0ACD3ZI26_FUSSC|nr:hypothetical protein LCI18_011706 [Fusarium solani-melongenae]